MSAHDCASGEVGVTLPFESVETVTEVKSAVAHVPFVPAAVRFQASGIGVICESSLYVYQFGLTGPFNVILSVVPSAEIDLMSSGIVPGT